MSTWDFVLHPEIEIFDSELAHHILLKLGKKPLLPSEAW